MCATTQNHLQSFKNAKVYEDASHGIFAIKGKAANGTLITLNFSKKEPPFCDGTTSTGTLVCRLDHDEWDVAKEHALANRDYFHVHGTPIDTKHVVSASVSYSSAP